MLYGSHRASPRQHHESYQNILCSKTALNLLFIALLHTGLPSPKQRSSVLRTGSPRQRSLVLRTTIADGCPRQRSPVLRTVSPRQTTSVLQGTRGFSKKWCSEPVFQCAVLIQNIERWNGSADTTFCAHSQQHKHASMLSQRAGVSKRGQSLCEVSLIRSHTQGL